MLESRLKLLSGETGLSMEQKIAEVQDTVRKAQVNYSKLPVAVFHTGTVPSTSDRSSNGFPSFSMPSQLSRVKAEGRLALLSANVAGAELLIQHAMSQAEEELERERQLSERRKSTQDFSVTQTRLKLERSRCLGPDDGADRGWVSPVFCQDDEFDLTDFEDYDDGSREVFAEPGAASQLCVHPTTCTVIYSYQVGVYILPCVCVCVHCRDSVYFAS